MKHFCIFCTEFIKKKRKCKQATDNYTEDSYLQPCEYDPIYLEPIVDNQYNDCFFYNQRKNISINELKKFCRWNRDGCCIMDYVEGQRDKKCNIKKCDKKLLLQKIVDDAE